MISPKTVARFAIAAVLISSVTACWEPGPEFTKTTVVLIEGTVRAVGTGAPIGGASVELRRIHSNGDFWDTYETIASDSTDSLGRYAFLCQGDQIKASYEGRANYRYINCAGETLVIDFYF